MNLRAQISLRGQKPYTVDDILASGGYLMSFDGKLLPRLIFGNAAYSVEQRNDESSVLLVCAGGDHDPAILREVIADLVDEGSIMPLPAGIHFAISAAPSGQ